MEPNPYDAPTAPNDRPTRHSVGVGMRSTLAATAWFFGSTVLGGVSGYVAAYVAIASMSRETFTSYGAVVASNILAAGLLGGLALGFVLAARTILARI